MGELVLTKEEIYCYVKKQYGTLPEHLWKKDPESAVLRHQNGKWYAVIMNVKKNVLGLQETGNVDIMNVKCDPEMAGLITQSYGYLPGSVCPHSLHMQCVIRICRFCLCLSFR